MSVIALPSWVIGLVVILFIFNPARRRARRPVIVRAIAAHLDSPCVQYDSPCFGFVRGEEEHAISIGFNRHGTQARPRGDARGVRSGRWLCQSEGGNLAGGNETQVQVASFRAAPKFD